MTKTILASLSGLASDRTVLEAAVAAARIEGGHIQCLHTRIDAVETAAMLESTAPRQGDLHGLLQQIAVQESERSAHAKGVFDEICKQYALVQRDSPCVDAAISIVWKESESLLNQTLHAARFHDLTVMGRDRELSAERIISVLMQSGRPLLLAPPKPCDAIGRTIAVAWKASAEAARALTAASFLLAKAQKVVILSVAEDAGDGARLSAEHLASQLAWQGIQAEIRMGATPAVSTSQSLVDMAYDCGADLLVMGAYGHNRVREFIFGGVTRELLATGALPLFMVR